MIPVIAEIDLGFYIPILVILIMALLFVGANLVLSHFIGPREEGSTKAIAYESGMNPIGSTRKRFNVRFYILAMTFLVFDVEIIFLYPWAVTSPQLESGGAESLLFLGRIMFFIGTSIIAYIYAWKKGVFRWD